MGYKKPLIVCTDLFIFVIFCVVFTFRFSQKIALPYHDGDRVIITSCLTEEPILQGGYQRLIIEGIIVKIPDTVLYTYGDCLQLTGTLQKRVTALFYSRFYLVEQEIAKIQPVEVDKGWVQGFKRLVLWPRDQAIWLRQSARRIYSQVFYAPHSQLLTGIMLGTREDFGKQFFSDLKNSGTLHIIAASGANLVFFAGPTLSNLAWWFGRRKGLVLTFFLIWFYVFLSGAQSSIVRAAVMLSLAYLAQFWGRLVMARRILLITAGFLLLINPLYLFDVGFWLSLAATSGLIFLSPVLQEIGSKIRLPGYLRVISLLHIKESLTETSAAYLATLPILLVIFDQISPLSVVPNILILWLIPYLMIGGTVIWLLGLICLPLVRVLGQILWPGLEYMVQVIGFFGRYTGVVTVKSLALSVKLLFIAIYYLILFLLVKKIGKKGFQ